MADGTRRVTDDDGPRWSDVRWDEADGARFITGFGRVGDTPPSHMAFLGYEVADATSEGVVTLRWDVPENVLNPAGMAHGGFLSAVLDDGCGLAVAASYPRFVPQLTLHLAVDFLAPVLPGPAHTVTGRVVRRGRGRGTSVADATIEDADGNLCARASALMQPNRRAIRREAWEAAGLV